MSTTQIYEHRETSRTKLYPAIPKFPPMAMTCETHITTAINPVPVVFSDIIM